MNEIAGSAASNGSIPPSPSTNRSALSEAWYRALYGAQRKPAPAAGSEVRELTARAAQSASTGLSPRAEPLAPAKVGAAVASAARRQLRALTITGSHRLRADANRLVAAPRAATAWRAALARRTACRLAPSAGAPADLLVQQRGRRLHIVAVTGSAADAARIGAALERARAALAAHGLRLEFDVRRKGLA